MISDDPDEDADTLDDDAAMDAFLGDTATRPNGAAVSLELADWPPRSTSDPELKVDAETLAWFKTTYVDWRRQMRAVLRAWMITNTAERHTSAPAAGTDQQSLRPD